MATATICAELQEGFDLSCLRDFARGFYQEAVFINQNDIDKNASVVGNIAGATCDYTVQMILKAGSTGVRVKLPSNGSTIKGWVDKTTNDNGLVEYLHKVQVLAMGVDAKTSCFLDKLDHGSYAVALQAKDGTVLIYGYGSGMSTGDYTYDISEGGGGGIIPLQSSEKAPESFLPLVYKPATGGDAVADFDALFAAAPVTP